MQKVLIVGKSFSKLVCGTNPFYAHNHFSEARRLEYKNRFDDREIEAVIERCLAGGINCLESSANERINAIRGWLAAKHPGEPIRLIGTTRIDDTSPLKRHEDKLDFLIRNGADICLIHSQYIDREMKGSGINGIERLLEAIHTAGLTAGISTHAVEVVELCERKNYAVDVYMFPLNVSGFVYPGYPGKETPAERAALVKAVGKPFILIKALGAGRIPPSEGLGFLSENCKENDLISLGFASAAEAEETIAVWEKLRHA